MKNFSKISSHNYWRNLRFVCRLDSHWIIVPCFSHMKPEVWLYVKRAMKSSLYSKPFIEGYDEATPTPLSLISCVNFWRDYDMRMILHFTRTTPRFHLFLFWFNLLEVDSFTLLRVFLLLFTIYLCFSSLLN